MANNKVQAHRASAKPVGKAIAKVAGRRASVEALNGGGFKTTLHHAPPSEAASMMGRHTPPTEAAHKNWKSARKAMDAHMGETGEPMEDTPEAQ